MKFTVRPFLLALFLMVMDVQPSFAFQLVPISRTFEPAGVNATQSYEVVNDSQERLAVNIEMAVRQIDADGKETFKPADEDFLVYPPQILLAPGARQTVRVSWLGDPKPAKELAYRIIAEQLPIDLDKKPGQQQPKGAVKLLIRYVGSVYIRPNNVKADVVLESVETIQTAIAPKQLALTFSNQGSAHAILKNLQLHLKSAQGTTVNLIPDQLKDVTGTNILAGNKRRFVIPYPAGLPEGPVTASFEFDKDN